MSAEKIMKCWICGNEANSAEHFIKASDLRALFGHVTQDKPIYMSTSINRNQPIRGIKSAKLKYNSLICCKCNNERTQKHDRAWESMSNYFGSKRPSIQAGKLLKIDNFFPGTVKASMLDVHLFFLKLFGCLIVEHNIPIDISQFSKAILNGTAHPEVHIAIGTGFLNTKRKHISLTPVMAGRLNQRIVYAGWFYIINQIAINIIYSELEKNPKVLRHSWHPSTVGKRVRMVDFSE